MSKIRLTNDVCSVTTFYTLFCYRSIVSFLPTTLYIRLTRSITLLIFSILGVLFLTTSIVPILLSAKKLFLETFYNTTSSRVFSWTTLSILRSLISIYFIKLSSSIHYLTLR